MEHVLCGKMDVFGNIDYRLSDILLRHEIMSRSECELCKYLEQIKQKWPAKDILSLQTLLPICTNTFWKNACHVEIMHLSTGYLG